MIQHMRDMWCTEAISLMINSTLQVESVVGEDRLVGCNPPSNTKCTEPVKDVGVILDQRLANITSVQTSGIDWAASERLDTRFGKLNVKGQCGLHHCIPAACITTIRQH